MAAGWYSLNYYVSSGVMYLNIEYLSFHMGFERCRVERY